MMSVSRMQSDQVNKADLDYFIEEAQVEYLWIFRSLVNDDVSESYADARVQYTPFLSRYICKKIDDLIFERYPHVIYKDLARAISHLYYGDNAKGENYTAPAWRIAGKGNVDLLNVFLSNCHSYQKTVGRRKILERNDGSIMDDTSEYCESWNLLAEAALFNQNGCLVSEIAAHFPTAVIPALAAIIEAEKLLQRYPQGVSEFSVEGMKNARYSIIMSLQSPLHDFYTVSYVDKRSIENLFLKKIQYLKCTQEVLEFYHKYIGAFVLNQHRIYAWACVKQFLFRQPELPYCTLQRRVIEALQKKFFEIVAEYALPPVMTKSWEILFSPSHFSRGVSVEWRDHLNALYDPERSVKDDRNSLTLT